MAGAVHDPDVVHARLAHGRVVIDHLPIDSPPAMQKRAVRLSANGKAAYRYFVLC
jgi:hypothetical protein